MSEHPDYRQFLATKRIVDPDTGISGAVDLPDVMMPHQRDITRWALRRGRAAIFAGTGLGKTLMELTWADRVAAHTDKPVLIFAPLAVSQQHIREAGKFGLSARIVRDQSEVGPGVNVTNYQKIEHFDLPAFGGVVLDESSVLKSTDGKYRTRLIAECSTVPFRLAATATPAPNDFMELGNHAEFLGVMSYTDMLATFFVHDGGETQKWRLKGHAENEFWKWMASWAVMLRQPSDLGYPNDGYDLPPLRQQLHTVAVEYEPSLDTGLLFPMEARTMQERLAARRDSIEERVELAFSVVISSFCDKFPEWKNEKNQDGSLNIRQIAKRASHLIQSTLRDTQNSKSAARERQKKIANTCAPITAPISTNGISERLSNESVTTPIGGSNTPPTTNLGNASKRNPEKELQNSVESNCLGPNTESAKPITMRSCAGRTDVVPSVIEEITENVSTSIIATTQEKLEDCCALHAILELDSSKTIPIGLPEQSNISGKLDRWVVWCQLNNEQDALEKAFGDLCLSVRGSKSDDENERAILAFIEGERPILLGKPSMIGFGLNLQCCHNTIFVGLNDSFEQIYQAIRRFWRFGQAKPVNVHFIASEMEGAVVANLRRKEVDADHMADQMVAHMADLTSELVRGNTRVQSSYNPTMPMCLPAWLTQEDAA